MLDQFTDECYPGIERKFLAAYAMFAKLTPDGTLDQIRRELERINPSAARSLEEGMEEMLTVHKLKMPEMLRAVDAYTSSPWRYAPAAGMPSPF